MSIFKRISDSFKRNTKETEQKIQGASSYDYGIFWGSQNDLVSSVYATNHDWVKRYHEMINHDSLVRAFASSLQLLLSSMTFSIKCNDEDEENEEEAYKEVAEKMFLDWGQGDFNEFTRQYVSTFLMGFSVFEILLRNGETGYELEGMAFHPQIYLTAKWEDDTTLTGFDSRITEEPLDITRCLYAQGVGNFDHNVYGHSLMRSAYIHYRNKIQIMGAEMYHVKANLEGIPVVYMDTDPTTKWQEAWNALKAQLLAIKQGKGSGLMLPSATYMDNDGKPSSVRRNDIKLMSVEGSKFIDTNELIKREDNAIARALMAEFLVMVGQDSGSYALSKETTSMFKLIVEGIAQHLCDTFTHQIIKPLWLLNGQDFDHLPSLAYDSVDLSLDGMATFLQALSGAGVVLTESQEDYLFDYAGLPRPTGEERLEKESDLLMMSNPPIKGVEGESEDETQGEETL